jgi:hypothetical protein
MTATNHALTGAAIGLIVGNPVIAIPAALLSHFVCDSIPHFGTNDRTINWLRSRTFKTYLLIDALLCFILVIVLFTSHPANWLTAAICAFAAASPDFFWIPKFLAARKGMNKKENAFGRFAGDIQWFQRPIGSAVEIAWFVAGVFVVAAFVA